MENKWNKSKTKNAERCKYYREKNLKEYRKKDVLRKLLQNWFWSPITLSMKIKKEPQNLGKTSWSLITNKQKSLWVPQKRQESWKIPSKEPTQKKRSYYKITIRVEFGEKVERKKTS